MKRQPSAAKTTIQANKKGNILIISAASGTGKTTLVSRLLKNNGDIHVSISHTIYQLREGERHGVHYHFVPKEEFEPLIRQNTFLEYVDVFGNYCGTSIADVDGLRGQGHDVILEINVQGAEQVRRLLPEACSIFVLPPSFGILISRLANRGTDNGEVIRSRLNKARYGIGQAPLFDYIITNDDLDTAETDLLYIIKAGRLKQTVQRPSIKNPSENS